MNRSFSQSRDVQITVSLSKLISSKRNPRRVKPERDAHRRMVASIRAHGLLAPLVVRADDASAGDFKVIAGNRRLAALRDVYKDSPRPPKVLCVLRSVDDDTADALALAENFVREPMHPLDEAEAFAKLAREEAKGVESIASEFGVSQPYVRQRMKLATLAEPVKAAYRQGGIDTATAEAFASVPPDRQLEVWQEVGRESATCAARSQRDCPCVDRRRIRDVRCIQTPGYRRQPGFVRRARVGRAQARSWRRRPRHCWRSAKR